MPRLCPAFLAMVICLEFVPSVATAPEVEAEEEAREAVAALATEDACTEGTSSEDPQCSLSLRQLRGEMQSVSAERHEAAPTPSTEEQQQQPASAAEVSSNTSESGDASEAQAPTYNYNWYFGDDDSKPPGVSQDVVASAGANGQPVYNYNWHFNFGMDNSQVKSGDCKTFGCLDNFDMGHLSDACQCYTGCDKSPFGNVCCPDFQQTCSSHGGWGGGWGGGGRKNRLDKYYFNFNNAFCHSGHGADQIGKPSWVMTRKQCRSKCTRDERCEGYVVFGAGHLCILLSRVDITHCERKHDYFSAMKNGRKWGQGGSRPGQTEYHPEPTVPGLGGYHPGTPSWGYNPAAVPGLWPWMR